MSDFIISDHGSIMLLYPYSEAAQDWLDENIGDEAQYHGKSLAIEPRYAGEIARGIANDGLGIITTH